MGDDDENGVRKTSSSESVCSYQTIPDADRELANQAFQEFEQRKYEQCSATLSKLISKRPQDSKVFHNACVTEFYLSSTKNIEIFNEKFLEVYKLAHIDLQDLDSLDDVDNCLVLYNKAVVLYHLHQFESAASILNKVFQYIEPLEETLAKNICFLLTELHICLYQPRKVLCYIGYIESQLLSSNKNCNKPPNLKEKDLQREENENSGSDEIRRKLQLYKARCYAMLKTSKACKREIKNLMSSGSGVQNIAAFYLKSQLEYQRGNYRKAIKLLQSASLPDNNLEFFKETGDCLPVIFNNNLGCIHFYMGKPHLGAFYVKRALTEFGNELKVVADPDNINIRPLHLMSISVRHQLLYNLGMQYLQGQKFEDAFHSFTPVLRSYPSNPRLWLRVAECCIYIDKPDNTEQFVECKLPSCAKSVVGAGPHRKLILNCSTGKVQNSEVKNINLYSGESPTLQFAMMCLKNALALIPEVPSSSPNDSAANCQNSEESDGVSEEKNTLLTLPSNFLQGAEIISLKNSILAVASYVALCLGDVIFAHKYAELLLSQPRLLAVHKFLAHLYAGEALLIMDRITEAVEHLSYKHPNNIELAYSPNSSELSLKHQVRFDSKSSEKNDDGSKPVGNIPNWMPNSISSVKFISLYNLAVAYAVREEWSKASECLQQMNCSGPVPQQALALYTYVKFHQGAISETKTHLKQRVFRRNKLI